jgi:type II secretory pathway pseudopilin PulG
LIETIVVLMVLGVLLGFYASTNLGAAAQVSMQFRAAQIADDIRYVQQLAIAGGREITFSAQPSRYMATCSTDVVCLADSDDCGPVLMDRTRNGGLCISLDQGLRFDGPQQVTFDKLGRPTSTGNIEFLLRAHGQPLASILVHADSGRVTFTP